jgi:hypothetical protein
MKMKLAASSIFPPELTKSSIGVFPRAERYQSNSQDIARHSRHSPDVFEDSNQVVRAIFYQAF